MTELSIIIKATFVLTVALGGAWLLRGTRASIRALLLSSALGVMLALPAAVLMVPARDIVIPQAYTEALVVFDQASLEQPLPAAAVVADHDSSPAWRLPSTRVTLRTLWAFGVIALLIRLGVALWRLRETRRSGLPWPEGDVLVHAIGRDAGVRQHVTAFVHEDLTSPMTFGVRRPAIGLPMDATQWNRGALGHAFVHELEHIRRGDWIVHILAHVVCALYWFHPLAWVAARRFCLEAERACDDAALRAAERTAYAEQLVSLARRLSRRDPAIVLSMAARSDLSMRVRAVLDARQARGPAGRLVTVAVLIAAVITVVTISPLRAVDRLDVHVVDHVERPTSNDAPGAEPAATPPPQAPAGRQPPPGLPQGLGAMVESPTTGPDAPRFAAASIKRSTSRENFGGTQISEGGPFRATNSTLMRLIQVAYGLRPTDTVLGGPDWARRDGYDVDARPDARASVTQARLMIRTLLADRFGLVVRTEKQDMPVYALTLARADRRLGPQLARPAGECTNPVLALARGANTPGGAQPAIGSQPPVGQPGRYCGILMNGGPGTLRAGSMALGSLATLLTSSLDRPVIDRTGLAGVFDFDLHFAAAPRPAFFGVAGGGVPAGPTVSPSPDDAPSVFSAVQEQLGLKLEPTTGLVDVLLIERAERPREN